MTENVNRKPLGNRLVVYTVLIGKKAELNKIPKSMGVDYVCLTDQEDLQSNGWQIRKITSMWPADFPRSSRHPKINAHLYFNEYSRSIYVDSSVQLTADPEKFWSKLVNSNEVVFGGVPHSFHLNMLEEINSVSKLGYESNSVLNTQVESFVGVFPEYLSARPIWGGVLARRHNHPDCVSAMEIWFSMITEHSRRDQLSLPLALRCLKGRQIQFSYLDNKKSQFHNWPVHGHQRSSDYTKIQSEILDLGVLDTQGIDSLPVNSLHVSAERDLVIAERDAILRTKTWRWTKFPRQLAFALKLKTGNIFKKHKKSAYKTLQHKYPEPGATIQSKILYKMAWDRNPKMRIYADKWRVRKYIKDRVGEDYLVPLLGVYRRPSSINYEKMPSEFVLKVNHGSGGVIVVSNSAPATNTLPRDIDSVGWERFEVQPANFASELANNLLDHWFKMDYEWRLGSNPEWAYKNIKRRVLVEELLATSDDRQLVEFKVYCFNGDPQIILKQRGRVSEKSDAYYDSNWQWIEVLILENGISRRRIPPEPPPKSLNKLLEIARTLSSQTDSIRVDFLEDSHGEFRVGELTNYPVTGLMEYFPGDFALRLGKDWTPAYRSKKSPWNSIQKN